MAELIWRAPEYEAKDRSALWYFGLGVVSVALVLVALWQENFLFAIFVVLAALVITALTKEPPPLRTFKLNDNGLDIDGLKALPFGRMHGFSVEESSENSELMVLVIHSQEIIHHTLHILIPREKLGEARAILASRLKEVPHNPSLFEELLKFLKL
jgi:hypothetical protein